MEHRSKSKRVVKFANGHRSVYREMANSIRITPTKQRGQVDIIREDAQDGPYSWRIRRDDML